MGITGRKLVRSVFSKSRSNGRQTISTIRAEKKRWSSSVRSYLCGDHDGEHNSVSFRSSTAADVDLASCRSNVATNTTSNIGGDCITSVHYKAEDDTTSVRSSEPTVNQPLHQQYPIDHENHTKETQNSTYKLFQQEDAALIIQSAFRRFRARRARDEGKIMQDDEEHKATASPSKDSIGTSIEVQTGNSSDIFSIKEESFDSRHTTRHRTRAQVLKIQEDWDDSTVSSVIAKMRLQSRLEAATRRERALAYAFSQQLRICEKKKQSTANGPDETNTGWSWLERWMAARQPEITSFIEDSEKALARKRSMLDAGMEEKESSCGSNEVSSLVEVPKHVPRPAKTRNKATRSFSRQNSATSHLCPREITKDVKKVCHVEDEKEKRKRAKQPGNKREIKNATTQVILENETEQ